MKKILSFVLAAVMLLSLAACGGSNDTPDDGINYDIVLCEVKTGCGFCIVLALYCLYICIRTDREQSLLHLNHFALSDIVVCGYHLTIKIGTIHYIKIYECHVAYTCAKQTLRTPSAYTTYAEDNYTRLLQSTKTIRTYKLSCSCKHSLRS